MHSIVILFMWFVSTMFVEADLSDSTMVNPKDLARQYMLSHPNENFVIQTDRDLYFSGTELWFSVWSLDDNTLRPFSYSGIVYIELMDKYGKSISQQILKLENNKASGKINLPEQMESGAFYLQAYSNMQRNFGEHLFGIRIIQVINPSKPPLITLPVNQRKPTVSVFPEGQGLISGITNKLVIKTTYPNGIYTDLSSGFLIKQPNDTIAILEFLVPGMGYCSFFAEPSFKYHLDLPGYGKIPLDIQDSGFTLNLQEGNDHLRIMANGKGIPDMEKYYLVGKNSGQVFFERGLEVGLKQVKIPFTSLPGGLLEFSILDSSFKECSQRLYYHDRNSEPSSSHLVLQQSSFQKGEIIDLEIQVPENKHFELISLSVSKDIFINAPIVQNFKSTVDLHPFINDWDEFLQLSSAIPAEEIPGFLNTYLITRMGSKFKWEDMVQKLPQKRDFFPEKNSKKVTGYAFNPVNSMRFRNDLLVLFFVGQEASLLSSLTDTEGRFSFSYPVQNQGISEIVLLPFGQNEGMEISLDWPYHQTFQPYQLDFFHFDSSRIEDYDKAYIQAQLEKMYKIQITHSVEEDKRIISFYGDPDSRIKLEKYISMSNMEEVFKEFFMGVLVKKRQGEYVLRVSHAEKFYILGDNPLILFNGYPVKNAREILNIPVSWVDFIDVVRRPYRIKNQIYDGIINVVGKDLTLHLEIPSNAYKSALEVFPQESRFSQPPEEGGDARIPALNPTLYWNPDLSIEGNSKHISFKAGDNPGRYQVLLRGIDTKGEVLEQVKYITIQ